MADEEKNEEVEEGANSKTKEKKPRKKKAVEATSEVKPKKKIRASKAKSDLELDEELAKLPPLDDDDDDDDDDNDTGNSAANILAALQERLRQQIESEADDDDNQPKPTKSRKSAKSARARALKFLTETDDDDDDDDTTPNIPDTLPILPLKDTVVYPMTVFPLAVGQERSIKLIEDLMATPPPRIVGLVAQKDASVEQAGVGDSFTIGAAAVVHKLLKVPDGTIRLAVQGIEKINIVEYNQTEPYLKAKVEVLKDEEEKAVEIEALMRNSISLFQRLVSLVPQIPEELLITAINVESPRQLAYLIATSVRMELEDRQQLLELDSVRAKLDKLNTFLTKELEVLELGRKIQNQVQDELGKTQREYFLREQIRALQKELGEDDPQTAEVNSLRELIKNSKMPAEARREAERELDRLSKLPPAAAEYGVIKTYLDWLTSLPWDKSTEGPLDIVVARQVLDEDHYDMDKVKERLLEYLAVRKLRKERLKIQEDAAKAAKAEKSEANSENGENNDDTMNDGTPSSEDIHYGGPREPILCLVGPPGVGKTSLGQSIARALGRKFTRMSLGGVRDEAEVRGHRRTYIGAMPGRIIQAIRRAESDDPVFMLDEVDKLGMDYRGDPSSALLEVLDPEQNRDFRDHYLDVPFDLSKVMFIATANLLDPIPAPLRDRMEILQLAGYTEEEKVHIAFRHLIPKQMKAHMLSDDDLVFEEAAVRRIIHDFTREAGVRGLEREVATVLRKVARNIAEGKTEKVVVNEDKVREFLGKPRYISDVAERTQQPGVATGLAVTQVGGDILFIEATQVPGSKQLTVTGQLGEVMKESASAALSLVRSKAPMLNINPNFFDKSDIHLHIPAGAIPKDGPSAGVAMTVALASLLTGRPVHGDVAMTGEITLRGKVLPIGGVKEKVLAAHRAGIKRVLLPRQNERDLDDIAPELLKEIEVHLVDNIEEALKIALEDKAVEPIASPNGYHDTAPVAAESANGNGNGTKPRTRKKVAKE